MRPEALPRESKDVHARHDEREYTSMELEKPQTEGGT
jgi:hypothetical protein